MTINKSWQQRGEVGLRNLAAVISAGVVSYAALDFGGVAPRSQLAIGLAMVVALVALVASWIIRRSLPALPRLPVLLVVGINIFGWAMALHPKFLATPVGETTFFTPLEPALGFLPGTIDGATSVALMWHVTSMSLGFVVYLDLLSERHRRWFFVRVLAISGVLVSGIGLYLKMSLSETTLWGAPGKNREFFAAFRYHGHAGAFLNLCWPACAVCLLRCLQRESNYIARALWCNALVITIAAVFANTSNTGHLVALVGLVMTWFALGRHYERLLISRAPIRAVVLVIFVGATGMVLTNWENLQHGWQSVYEDGGSLAGRIAAYSTGWTMYLDAPFFGAGPGAFSIGYDSYHLSEADGHGAVLIWEHLHQDYLQTMIEWGLIGAAAWFALFFLGYWRGVLRCWRGLASSRPRGVSHFALLLATTLLGIHAAVDFPLQVPAIQLVATACLAALWTAEIPPMAQAASSARESAPDGRRGGSP